MYSFILFYSIQFKRIAFRLNIKRLNDEKICLNEFTAIQTNYLSQVNIPYDVSLDLFECQIRECKSLAEKLATSFANVENLFILITLFLFLTLTCLLNWRSSSDHV
eukprot:TRINITY_DN6198_c0_g1_i9.p2 TRINITY_DN6198_c0_g1~~TRINITY_DN6198_c0_g1_i9.p2  ORF type:complete len:106 (-),score=3.72 TRINITY_DN6198_c0_g1_i9:220-537(-)